MTATATFLLGGFLLGSIPFGYVLVRALRGQDVRTVGSGNIGATNVGRVLGRWGALASYGAKRFGDTRRLYGYAGNSFLQPFP